MNSPDERAQQWHDEEHGSCEEGGFSFCYCCCTLCDPNYDLAFPNPYWWPVGRD